MFLVTFEQIRTVTVAKRGKLDASSVRGDAYYATFFFFFLNSFFYFFILARWDQDSVTFQTS